MPGELRKWWRARGLFPLALLTGCAPWDVGVRDAPPAEPTAFADLGGSFGTQPRLFARAGERPDLHVYLPQPTGSGLVVRAGACETGQLRAMFGIPRVELVDLLSDDEAAELERLSTESWTFPCPAPKPIRTEYVAASTWNVALPREAATTPSDAGTTDASTIVLSIPQTCDGLITHFQVRERAREERGLDGGVPLIPSVVMSCGKPGPMQAGGGFSADLVLGNNRRPLVRLSQGNATIYVHRVDGLVPDPNSQERTRDVLTSLGTLLQIPSDRQTVTLDSVPMPEVALDLCTRSCEGFVPSHLVRDGRQLSCTDKSAPDAQGKCPAAAPRLALRERLDRDGTRVLDLTRPDDASFRGATFATCAGLGGWAQPLGLVVQRDELDLVEAAKKSYLAPIASVVTPCVRDSGCSVAVAADTDLPTVLSKIRSACWRNEQVVTLRLAGNVRASRALVLAAAEGAQARCNAGTSSELLPCSISTVRLVGARDGLEVAVPTRYCGALPCTSEVPAVSVSGQVTFEVDGVAFRATNDSAPPVVPGDDSPKPNPALPGNRLAIEATRGASVVVRRATVGAAVKADAPIPLQLYTGIRLDNASLVAFQSPVRAYATAVNATRSRVVVMGGENGEATELSVLGGVRRYVDLVNLANGPMAKPTDFTALRLDGTGSRGFLGSATVTAPVGITYLGPGSGSADLTVYETQIGWNVGCSARVFVPESRALLVYGTGELILNGVVVKETGRLLECVEPARASITFAQASTFQLVDPRIDPGRCQVRRQFEPTASACPR